MTLYGGRSERDRVALVVAPLHNSFSRAVQISHIQHSASRTVSSLLVPGLKAGGSIQKEGGKAGVHE